MSDNLAPNYYVAPGFHASQGTLRDVIDPATLEVVAQRAEVTQSEIATALASVNAAQKMWAQTDAKSRAAILHKLASAIEAHDMTDCAILMSREMGKPYPEAIGEVANCAPKAYPLCSGRTTC